MSTSNEGGKLLATLTIAFVLGLMFGIVLCSINDPTKSEIPPTEAPVVCVYLARGERIERVVTWEGATLCPGVVVYAPEEPPGE